MHLCSNYLKDLHINFSLQTHPLKDQKIVAANTIQSYKNQADSMLQYTTHYNVLSSFVII